MKRINAWIKRNIGEGEDYTKSKNHLRQAKKGKDIFDLELPDIPSSPNPGESLPKYGLDLLSDTGQGFILDVITSVLKHIIKSDVE